MLALRCYGRLGRVTKGANMPEGYPLYSYESEKIDQNAYKRGTVGEAIANLINKEIKRADEAEAALEKERELVKRLIEAALGILRMERIKHAHYIESQLFFTIAEERGIAKDLLEAS